MWKVFGGTKELAVGPCGGCVPVCDRRCRADELARQTFSELLRQGWRLA